MEYHLSEAPINSIMTNHNTILPEDAELALTVKFFLRNNPYKACKKTLWKQYAAWVHLSAEAAGPKDHADMLFFYERLSEFLKELNQWYKKESRSKRSASF